MLSSNLEITLRNAYQLATDNKHEFVTLEHLLNSLTNDKDAISVLKACCVEIEELKKNLEDFIKNDLSNLKDNFTGEPKLTNSFQRVLQRAAIHVQSSGRESVTGANMIGIMMHLAKWLMSSYKKKTKHSQKIIKRLLRSNKLKFCQT